ncbi:MAG TPA: V-type ATP synthase subunit D [Anaeromyxobacter sp.]|nr:V-type ATP synthase subunit D [Anaeromyxobacter sp.]
MAEAQGAVLRIGRELKRAQRRCNALTKMVIPDHRKAIRYVAGALEEREREAFMDRKLRRRRRAGS